MKPAEYIKTKLSYLETVKNPNCEIIDFTFEDLCKFLDGYLNSQWIDVKDDLPESDVEVLVTDGFTYIIASYNDRTGLWDFNRDDFWNNNMPTHWKKLIKN